MKFNIKLVKVYLSKKTIKTIEFYMIKNKKIRSVRSFRSVSIALSNLYLSS